MNQKIIPLISVAVGFVAFLLTYQFLRGKEMEVARRVKELEDAAEKIEIVAATRDVPGGQMLQASDVDLIKVPVTIVRDDMVRKNQGWMLLGKKTVFQLTAWKPIQWSDIEGGEKVQHGLAPIVRPGSRALSLAVGGAAAVSGMIQPKDHVDVLGTFSLPARDAAGGMETVTLTVLQDVTVLATGQQLAKDLASGRLSMRSTGYTTVTVEVKPREAELLVFAQQMQGRLTLTLRNPTDLSFEKDLPQVNFKLLESELSQLNTERQRTARDRRLPER